MAADTSFDCRAIIGMRKTLPNANTANGSGSKERFVVLGPAEDLVGDAHIILGLTPQISHARRAGAPSLPVAP